MRPWPSARLRPDRRRPQAEADEFYAELTPQRAAADEAAVMRQAFSGLLWSKQFYHYDVTAGSTATRPSRPAARARRPQRALGQLRPADVLSMPDKWEYPWFAAWDLAFHCVVLADVDPGFAKHQLLLLCRSGTCIPNGQLPAYEWDFGDVNPPVQAWAALRGVRASTGPGHDFLERIFHKLLINFTWWVNREDAAGNNLFQGGFLGLDNIGPFDRSPPPARRLLEQSDGTGWMALYCLTLPRSPPS